MFSGQRQDRTDGREDAGEPSAARWQVTTDAGGQTLLLSGDWRLGNDLPAADEVAGNLAAGQKLRLDGSGLAQWDTGLMVFMQQFTAACQQRGAEVDSSGLPEGAARLHRLATAVPPATQAPLGRRMGFFGRVGASTLALVDGSRDMLRFIGEATLSFGRLLTGRARFRSSDFWLIVQQCGADALPIVSLISFLVGMILAFVGFIQLRQFGAEIFVADLVGIAMARDIAGIMAAIVMAGRTGAAFAAQLGTMQVNEEIDALTTFGIAPMDFLVLPRMLALMVMLPLLTVYANLLGIMGGAFVGVLEPSITLEQYWRETVAAVTLVDFAGGLAKSCVYGVLVALAGCLRGMQCGRSAAAVGEATTSAVVTGIVSVVLACALLTIVYDVVGI